MSRKFIFTQCDDGMRRPPAFTKCLDCGCCYADLYADKDPICWACDAGEPCKAKAVAAATAHNRLPPQPQPSPQPAPSVQEKPMGIASTHHRTTRISDEVRAAIIAADPSVKHAELARKHGISDVSVFTIRKAAGIVRAKAPRSKTAPKAARSTDGFMESNANKIQAVLTDAVKMSRAVEIPWENIWTTAPERPKTGPKPGPRPATSTDGFMESNANKIQAVLTDAVKMSRAVEIPAAVSQPAPRVSDSDTFVVTLHLTLGELEAIFFAMSPEVKVIAISAALQHKAATA